MIKRYDNNVCTIILLLITGVQMSQVPLSLGHYPQKVKKTNSSLVPYSPCFFCNPPCVDEVKVGDKRPSSCVYGDVWYKVIDEQFNRNNIGELLNNYSFRYEDSDVRNNQYIDNAIALHNAFLDNGELVLDIKKKDLLSHEDTTLFNKHKLPWKLFIGGGCGYYFFSNDYRYSFLRKFYEKVGLSINVISNYSLFSLNFNAFILPSTPFGVMFDGYLNLGLFLKIKKTYCNLYLGTNIIGKGTKKYYYYYNSSYKHEVEYSNQFNDFNPGLQVLVYFRRNLYFFTDIMLMRYSFYEDWKSLPSKYADRYKPYFGRTIGLKVGIYYSLFPKYKK